MSARAGPPGPHLRWGLLAIVLLALALPSQAQSPLEFRIALTRTAVRPGEPVPCRMELVNRSPQPVRVNARLLVNWPDPSPHEVYFQVTGPSGYLLPFQLRVCAGDPIDEDYVLLAPGESTFYDCDLAECFPLRSPGPYRVEAVYENSQGGPSVWTGRLSSNVVEFRLE